MRRMLRLQDERSRPTCGNYKPGASGAAYFGALWALGLLNQADELSDPDRDEEGKILESARSLRQAPRRQRLDNVF